MELTFVPRSSDQGQPSDYQQHDQTDGLGSKGATVGDQRDVLAMQIEPVFHRRFNLAAVVALGMSVVVAYQNTLATLGFILYNGGTGGVFFGYILVIIGFTPVYASLAELSSCFSTAAGQFQWVAECAPIKYRARLAFYTACLSVIAWTVFIASCSVIIGNNIRDCVLLYYPDSPIVGHPVFPGWFSTLIAWLTLYLGYLFNTSLARWLHIIEKIMLVIHLAHFVDIIVVLLVTSPQGHAGDVLLTFNNGGSWPGQLSFFVGLINPSSSMIGYDSATHMAENVRDASINVPKAMLYGFGINALMAFAMATTFIFTCGDVGDLLAAQTVQPYIAVFLRSTGSETATVVMVAVIILNLFTALVSEIATGSRQMWSLARDGGLPFANNLESVTDHEYPGEAVKWTAFIAAIMTSVNLFSAVGFNALASLVVVALTSSYTICLACLIYLRARGQDLPSDRRFSLGRAALPVNIVACLFVAFISVFSVFPPDAHPTAKSMNWSVLMFAVILISAEIYYELKGHKEFKPKMRKAD